MRTDGLRVESKGRPPSHRHARRDDPHPLQCLLACPRQARRLRRGGLLRRRPDLPSGPATGRPDGGQSRYFTINDVPAGTRAAQLRFSGRTVNTTMLFGLRIDADYRQPHGGFRPVKITYVWDEDGQQRTDEHVATARRPIHDPLRPEDGGEEFCRRIGADGARTNAGLANGCGVCGSTSAFGGHGLAPGHTCIRQAAVLDCAVHSFGCFCPEPHTALKLFSRSPAHAKRESIPESEHAANLPHSRPARWPPGLCLTGTASAQGGSPGRQRRAQGRHRVARRRHHLAAVRSRGGTGGARTGAESQLRPDRSPGEGVEGAVQAALLQGALQRHQRDHGDVLRPGPAARQRDHGPLLDVLGHDHADAVLRPGAGLRRHPSPHAQLRPGRRQTQADQEHQGDVPRPLLGPARRHGPHLRLRQGEGADRPGRRLPRARRVAARQADGRLGPDGLFQLPGQQAAAGHRGRHGQLPEPGGLRAGGDAGALRVPAHLRRRQQVRASTAARGWA